MAVAFVSPDEPTQPLQVGCRRLPEAAAYTERAGAVGQEIIVVEVEARLAEVGVGVHARQNLVQAVLEGAHDVRVRRVVIHPEGMTPAHSAEVNSISAAGALLKHEVGAGLQDLVEHTVETLDVTDLTEADASGLDVVIPIGSGWLVEIPANPPDSPSFVRLENAVDPVLLNFAQTEVQKRKVLT